MSDTTQPCSQPESRQLDFWLGNWDLSWPAEQTGGEPGETATGTNSITQLFGDCVIEENFATADGRFRGHSVSVYDVRTEQWRQTWVDNMGGYLVFTGGFEDGSMVLRTPPTERDGTTYVHRMVFSDIENDSLTWRWQNTVDDGATWQDVWTISYNRRP